MSWRPPLGSVEVEPGYHQAPNGDVYCGPDTWDLQDTQRLNAARVRDRERRDKAKRLAPLLLSDAHDEILRLQGEAFWLREALNAALVLLTEERERHAFTDYLLAGVLREHQPTEQYLRAA